MALCHTLHISCTLLTSVLQMLLPVMPTILFALFSFTYCPLSFAQHSYSALIACCNTFNTTFLHITPTAIPSTHTPLLHMSPLSYSPHFYSAHILKVFTCLISSHILFQGSGHSQESNSFMPQTAIVFLSKAYKFSLLCEQKL